MILTYFLLLGTLNNAGLGLPFSIFGGLGAGGLAVPTTPIGRNRFSSFSLNYLIECELC